jgi:hypothetical protein
MKDNLSNRKIEAVDNIKSGDPIEVSSAEPLISIVLSDKNGNVKKTIDVIGCRYGIFIRRQGNVGYYKHITTGKIMMSPMDRIIKTNKK